MNLREYTYKIENVLMDEELLRLLYYMPKNVLDNPLDTAKPNILDKPTKDKWAIFNDKIMTASNFNGFDTSPICRLFYYAGNGRSAKDNYLFSKQQFHFDVFVHQSIENTDKRLEWICDRVNELVFNKSIAGLGKTLFIQRHPVSAPVNYVGYRLIYEFCHENY
ncbi:hypothetical protein BAOM_3115 [Peribacillus asahii]|uniref:Uncharacterized protein n=1 Tax=Peribacillus asahii TaxID=228899 RepID=A0A3T0KU54_9BACI|nr:hypothetical protein [Peribacillus asahii]AZV43724.1 hypothetical protein BAOM_3115 [Peribacillus asahii]